MDISPQTKAGIIDINIGEEACVHDILAELVQRFGQQESEAQLRLFLLAMLDRLITGQHIVFYEYCYLHDTRADIAPDSAYQILHNPTFWQQGKPKLYVSFNQRADGIA